MSKNTRLPQPRLFVPLIVMGLVIIGLGGWLYVAEEQVTTAQSLGLSTYMFLKLAGGAVLMLCGAVTLCVAVSMLGDHYKSTHPRLTTQRRTAHDARKG